MYPAGHNSYLWELNLRMLSGCGKEILLYEKECFAGKETGDEAFRGSIAGQCSGWRLACFRYAVVLCEARNMMWRAGVTKVTDRQQNLLLTASRLDA